CPDGDSIRSVAFLDVGAHRRADQLHWIFGAAPPALLEESALACAGKRFGMVRGPQHERRFALSKNNGSDRTNHARTTEGLRTCHKEGNMQKLSSCLITLGTAAGPSLRPDRVQSCNLLTVNGTHYVVDAGDGVARRIAQSGIDVREIGTIFIT